MFSACENVMVPARRLRWCLALSLGVVVTDGRPGLLDEARAVPPPGVVLPKRATDERADPPLMTATAGVGAAPLGSRVTIARAFGITGADDCREAVIVSAPVGPPGAPITTLRTGSGTVGGGPDCDGSFGDVWWEAFEIDRCAKVIIDFCASLPTRRDPHNVLVASCEAPGGSCRPFIAADTIGGGCPDPDSDRNLRLTFNALPPGVYYYPLDCQGPDPETGECSPYHFNVTAEECVGECGGCFGACCDTVNRTCADGVAGADCLGPTQKFTFRGECCSLECRPPVTDYDAYGMKLRSHLPPGAFPAGSTRANDCWGYVSPSGREYAILGLDKSTGFVEITDPDHPVIVADVLDANSFWSDMQTYGHYCYNVNESTGGVQILNLAAIDDGIVTVVGSARGGMNTAHDLEIDPVSGFLYPCGTDIVRGFLAFDLADPADPAPAGFWDEVYVHDLFVETYDACPYAGRTGRCEIAFAFAGGAGLKVIDVTNKQNMQTLATLLYPNVAYSHQGWLSRDRSYVFMDDESDEGRFDLTATTYVIDVRNVAQPAFVTTFTTGICSIDHNLMVRGDLVFEANYTTGMRVFDVSDVMNAVPVAHFDTHPADNAMGFRGAWGVFSDFPSGTAIASDITRGLFVVSLCDELPSPRADFDGSGGVDLRDVARFQACFGHGAAEAFCDPPDLDCDREVDLDDLLRLESESTGP